MKEQEGYVDCPEQQMILYVEKDDGQYGPIQTGSFITKHYLEDWALKRNNLIKSLKDQLNRNEISPIKFFMVLEDLTLSELVSRSGIPSRRVKKHLTPAGYSSITKEQLDRYSTVFNVDVERLQRCDPEPVDVTDERNL